MRVFKPGFSVRRLVLVLVLTFAWGCHFDRAVWGDRDVERDGRLADVKHDSPYGEVVTNGVALINGERWSIEDTSLNQSFVSGLPDDRALIFEISDARNRVILDKSEKRLLRWCLEGARIEDLYPAVPSLTCHTPASAYVLGIGDLCKCEACLEDQEAWRRTVGSDYAFVWSRMEICLDRNGSSCLKFENDVKREKFQELIMKRLGILESRSLCTDEQDADVMNSL